MSKSSPNTRRPSRPGSREKNASSVRKVGEGMGEQVQGRATDPGDRVARKRSSPMRLFVLVVVLLVAGLGLWWSGQLSETPRAWGRKALVENRIEDAKSCLLWAERLSAKDYRNSLLAARIARETGDVEELKRQLELAIVLGAPQAEVERERVFALAQAGELDIVEKQLFGWLVSEEGEPAEISAALANGLAAVGRFDEAVTVISAWRNDFPEDPRCDYRLGRIFEHQERYDDAEARYRESLVKFPQYYPAAFSLGRVLLNQRRVDEAVEMFRYCLGMSEPAAAKIEMAVALKSLGRGDEARELLQQVLELRPDAQRHSYATIEEEPEGFRAAAEYGRLESDAGNFETALPWLRKALQVNPLDLTVRYSLGVTLRGLGQFDEAEKEFEHVRLAREAMGSANALNERIKRDPDDVEARFELGKLVLENESERVGLYWIRSIFAHDPEYAPAHRLLADYYDRKSRESDTEKVELRRRADFHRRFIAGNPPIGESNPDTRLSEPS